MTDKVPRIADPGARGDIFSGLGIMIYNEAMRRALADPAGLTDAEDLGEKIAAVMNTHGSGPHTKYMVLVSFVLMSLDEGSMASVARMHRKFSVPGTFHTTDQPEETIQ